MDKAAITNVLEKLGSDRVERGLVAFHEQDLEKTVWERCFLGRALTISQGDTMCMGAIDERLAQAGIAKGWGEVAHAFDGGNRADLHALVLEWLEQNRVAAPTLIAVS